MVLRQKQCKRTRPISNTSLAQRGEALNRKETKPEGSPRAANSSRYRNSAVPLSPYIMDILTRATFYTLETMQGAHFIASGKPKRWHFSSPRAARSRRGPLEHAQFINLSDRLVRTRICAAIVLTFIFVPALGLYSSL